MEESEDVLIRGESQKNRVVFGRQLSHILIAGQWSREVICAIRQRDAVDDVIRAFAASNASFMTGEFTVKDVKDVVITPH